MLFISMIEAQSQINCMGERYICTTENTYLLCFDDPRTNTTVTVADRVSLCPAGTVCDVNGAFCDSGKKSTSTAKRQNQFYQCSNSS